jgi:hypothetical protein
MGRNYFSRHGGPYFINNGFSQHHDHDHNELSNHEHSKQDPEHVFIAIAFLSLVAILSIVMIAL